jgi:uncharacterized protein
MDRSTAPIATAHAQCVRSKLLASTCGLLMLAGCAGGVSRQDVAGFDADLARGNYPGAAQLAIASGQIAPDGKSNNLAWSLNAGAALVYAGEPSHAVQVLDGAEQLMTTRDVSNFGNTQYDYATYDGIMVNTYKALAFLGTGNKADARVEFNRVGDRQARAEREFAEQKAKLDAQAQRRAAGNFDLNGAIQSAQNDQTYRAVQAELGQYANYKPFINPAASYLRAIYLLNNADTASDFETARSELKRVADMTGPSPAVQADLALATAGKKGSKPYTWVVFEDGQAPTFAQYNITFPVPVVGRGGHVGSGVVTVAMPRMVFHAPAAPCVDIVGGGAQTSTTPIGDFDRVMASEFSRRQPAIMTRMVLEAVLKAGLQTAASQTGNGLLQLAAVVVSNVSTADTRSWTALPKGFQAARVDAPKDGMVHLRIDGGVDLGNIPMPPDQASIVYVKELASGGKPSIQVFRL